MSRLDLKTLRLFAAICEAGTLNGAARRAAIAPSAVSKRLVDEGFETEKMSPAALTAFVQNEITKWGPLAKKLIPAEKPQ